MSPGYFASIQLLLRAHRGSGLSTQAHVLGRFLTCPFLRAVELLPPGCRLLDIGAGHGTFARLALAAGATEAVAIEPDLRKALTAAGENRLRFIAGFSDAVRGVFDAVSMCDVLYRMPLSAWDDLFAQVHSLLAPGGTFLLKEIDPDARLKAFWNKAQEAAADRLFQLSIGDHFAYESRQQLRSRLERAGFTDFEAYEIGAGYPHAHIAYRVRRG